MDIGLYLEVRQLFVTKWDPAVLDVLAERPCRYLALVRKLRCTVDDLLVDSHVTRCLSRLQDLGLVRTEVVVQGRREYAVYSLTEEGRRVLTTYRTLLVTYARARSRAPVEGRCQACAYTGARSGDRPDRGTNEGPLHAGEGR